MNRRGFLLSVSATALAAPALAHAHGGLTATPPPLPRETLSLDDGWRFHEGDIPMPIIIGHGWSYANAKAGAAWGAASPAFDDSTWDQVRLPHDFVVSQPFDQNANISQGYRKRGVAWYRRALRFEPTDRGRHIELQFGAAATNATVWFNGTIVERNFSGYNSFSVDLTPFVRYGDQTNSLVVRIDANAMEGWWYEGGGLYRHVWLVKRSPIHIATDGVHADPRKGANGQWTVPATVTVANVSETRTNARAVVELVDARGAVVSSGYGDVSVDPLESADATMTLAVADPKLWSVDQPNLYTVRARVEANGAASDSVELKTGFRTFRFDAEEGFYLNDQWMKIHGVCVHQDHAGVGVAVPDAIWDFRTRRLKEMGCNAIRISHHAPAVELLDACDKYGMLVLDENRVFNPSPEYLAQLEWLVRRDRNRASVFMWSVFNEEPMQASEQGYQMVRRMHAAVKELDDSRPVTAAMNGGQFTPINVSHAVDVVGFNYAQDTYDRYHAANPTTPMLSTEDTSAFMTRGAWETDKARNVIASDDSWGADWGATHRAGWKAVAERKFVAGAFVWTGFDYRGEPTPFEWPSASSFFGCMDLCGFPKTAFFMHQAQWRKDIPVLHVAPHWNWPDKVGQPIKVMVISNAEEVELVVNGTNMGRQPVDPYEFNTWETVYAPGRLVAIGYAGGVKVSEQVVETTEEARRIRLTPDRTRMLGDGRDAQPITVEVLDRKNRPIPNADTAIRFIVEGGAIIGLGNGDPNSREPEKGVARSLFNGLAQVIVQTWPSSRGQLRLRAVSTDLRFAEAIIDLDRTEVPSAPLVAPVMMVEGWRHAPISAQKPDPNVQVSDSDQNSWTWVTPGTLIPAPTENGFVLIRVKFTPYQAAQVRGGVLNLGRMTGPAEIWLDGQKARDAQRDEQATLRMPPKAGERTVAIVMAVRAGEAFGFRNAVTSGY
ncbi:beta-galactosidase GalA [Brevundimonas sp. Leaf363]|uniref:beta-galactosidase GalA n=1 Tax=Brevundimonas sp. Leaf363 TaxID=1736353 RepID=UPI0009E9BF4C|nr:beta-galactosidase GalA [Brevundimonas sp. Leaf363]